MGLRAPRLHDISQVDRVLICCAVFLSITAGRALTGALPTASSEFRPGDRFTTLANPDVAGTRATIILVVSSSCGASLRSVEAFRRMAQMPRGFRVVLAGYDSQEQLKAFSRESRINADWVVSAPQGAIRFARVPAVAVLDDQGIVRSTWHGSQQIAESLDDILGDASTLASQKAREAAGRRSDLQEVVR